ncbi:ATPase/histidine kinase/DNA gyrase B/HSP90 domain protein [Streptomyces graminofaciens]|uniref:ATPase/histidine kinase/DNA gyrase B/HSP90 domain protein n=1 Tax=Streptomyces graminofaciens TaxID=68212 RepID=A0ABM7F119_9ACTN|nr:ATP-binding protein [Streptomyces graminofaciens]BBC29232.1 ATPase/histidine kinase/DNA gyrase B/HSP90 domain protein [Streptomyces graminofaciens]
MISLRRSRVFQMAVPAHPSCAAGVRRAVAAHLELWDLTALLDDAVLATDELFANAVRHASSDSSDTVAVVLECSERELRVTLADSSPALPVRRAVDGSAESGRGLSIVAALADDWGTEPPEPGAVGKKVWFSLVVREPSWETP